MRICFFYAYACVAVKQVPSRLFARMVSFHIVVWPLGEQSLFHLFLPYLLLHKKRGSAHICFRFEIALTEMIGLVIPVYCHSGFSSVSINF